MYGCKINKQWLVNVSIERWQFNIFETNGLDSKIDTPTKARHGETKNLESPKTATRESQWTAR